MIKDMVSDFGLSNRLNKIICKNNPYSIICVRVKIPLEIDEDPQ